MNSALALSFNTKNGTMTLNRESYDMNFENDSENLRRFSISQDALFLQIFVDHLVIEISIKDRQIFFTARVFPNNKQTGILLEGENSLFFENIWTLRSMESEE